MDAQTRRWLLDHGRPSPWRWPARTSVSVLLCLAAGHCDCEKDAQSGSWDGNMANEPRRLIATATHQRDRLIIFLVVLVVSAALAVGWYYLSQ